MTLLLWLGLVVVLIGGIAAYRVHRRTRRDLERCDEWTAEYWGAKRW